MMKNLKKCKNKKGFTMVELIVVIVIILILGAFLVPSLMKYIERANIANAKADAATLLVECQAELADLAATGEAIPEDTVTTDGTYVMGTDGEMLTFTYTKGEYTSVYTASTGQWVVNKGDTQVWPES